MNRSKYKTDPNILLEQRKLIMSSTNESKFRFRIFAINMVLAGCSTSVVAELAGISKVSVNNLVKIADESGFDALRAVKQSGRPSKLSDDQLQLIDAALQSNPEDYGLEVWVVKLH